MNLLCIFFYYINVMNMMRIPNLSGIFDYGPHVSGEYKKLKIVNLTGKSFEKQFTFQVSDTGYI